MAKHIMRCAVCHEYTLKDTHCNKKTISPKPPKYSPLDPYGKYRRMAKKDSREKEGLI